jgi:hypothetical protein
MGVSRVGYMPWMKDGERGKKSERSQAKQEGKIKFDDDDGFFESNAIIK